MKLIIRGKHRVLFLKQAGWIKIWGYYLSYKSPKSEPLFSERNGYQKPFLKFRGWRFFLIDDLGRTGMIRRESTFKIKGVSVGRWSGKKPNIIELPKSVRGEGDGTA